MHHADHDTRFHFKAVHKSDFILGTEPSMVDPDRIDTILDASYFFVFLDITTLREREPDCQKIVINESAENREKSHRNKHAFQFPNFLRKILPTIPNH